MRTHLILAASFGLALMTAGCQTKPDNPADATAAAQAANNAQRYCVNTGSRLGGSCNTGGHADAKDILNRPQQGRPPGS
ncbi:MAG: hypothetical protein PW843_23740 [Azospirillaceae bacterium]|nr:hypothetical protein [Azospirillaceae bacterium]